MKQNLQNVKNVLVAIPESSAHTKDKSYTLGGLNICKKRKQIK